MEVLERIYTCIIKVTPKGLLINGQIVIDKQNIANIFNQYFICIGQGLSDKLTPAPPYTPANPPDIPMFKFPTVTTEFVLKQLQSMPENKAVDLDKLPSKLLRAAALMIAQPLAFILNLSLQFGNFISEWKHAKVLPLHKTGLQMERNNYRPISILPINLKYLKDLYTLIFPYF